MEILGIRNREGGNETPFIFGLKTISLFIFSGISHWFLAHAGRGLFFEFLSFSSCFIDLQLIFQPISVFFPAWEMF